MEKLTITNRQARRFILAYQKLWSQYELEGKKGILSYFEKVCCIQFDPLNVVGSNQELVLQSRIKNYRPSLLQDLLYNERKLIDHWDKNMSIYRIEDWPYFKRTRELAKDRYKGVLGSNEWIIAKLREKLESEGPLSSLDLDYNEIINWSWAPTRLSRAALESMFFWGEAIIHHKVYTRRVYDLAKRHIDESLLYAPDPNITDEEYYAWYVLRRISSIGLLWNKAGDAWLGINGLKSENRNKAFNCLIEQKQIMEFSLEGTNHLLYIKSNDIPILNDIDKWDNKPKRAFILAPLDNMMWDRKLIKELFNFEYRWEVYKKKEDRKYGYYVLPVVYDDYFIARFEPILDKKNSTLIIKNWWWEENIEKSEEMYSALKTCFDNFCYYLDVKNIEISDDFKKDRKLLIFND